MIKYLKVGTTAKVPLENSNLTLGQNLLNLTKVMGCYLRGVEVRYKTIKDTDFSYSHLEGSDFLFCKILNCDFAGANLEGCDFRHSKLAGCCFTNATLAGCKGTSRALTHLATCRYFVVVTKDTVWLDHKQFNTSFFLNKNEVDLSELPSDGLDNVMSKANWVKRYLSEIQTLINKAQ